MSYIPPSGSNVPLYWMGSGYTPPSSSGNILLYWQLGSTIVSISITENLVSSDLSSSVYWRLLIESIHISDINLSPYVKILIENLVLTDLVILSFWRSILESITISDNYSGSSLFILKNIIENMLTQQIQNIYWYKLILENINTNTSNLTYTATGDILLWWRGRTKNLLMGFGGSQYGSGYGSGILSDVQNYVVEIYNNITNICIRKDTINIIDQTNPDFCYIYTKYQNGIDNGGTFTKNLTFWIYQVNFNEEYSEPTIVTCS